METDEEEPSQVNSDIEAAPVEPAVAEETEESPSDDGVPMALIIGVDAAVIALGLGLLLGRRLRA